jgi:3-deoxy-manno-octulosonate cytidylyltransferase (CMP-KDO synthetase)
MSTRAGVIAVIPARYASKRLPGKPLADIGGRPMIRHVVERTARASLVDRVIVAADDERVQAAVTAFGGEVVMTDPALPSGTDRCAAVARTVTEATIVVNVQGDEPLIEPEVIDASVRPLLDDATVSVATPVRVITKAEELENPHIPKVVLDRNGNCLYFSRSPIPFYRDGPRDRWPGSHRYYRHIGLYVFRRDVLLRFSSLPPAALELAERLEQLRLLEYGIPIRGVTTNYDSLPVDTPEDLERVRTILRRAS